MSAMPDPIKCQYCGGFHETICPRIKRVEYSDMNPGLFKVVEFFAPNEYPKIEARELRYFGEVPL